MAVGTPQTTPTRFPSRAGGEAGLRPGRLEELDRVPGRVLDQDLPAGDAGHDLVAEAGTSLAQPLDSPVEVGDLDGEPVPAPGRRQRAVGHGLAAPARAAPRRAQHEAK